jgi:hypothetical protein
MLVSGHWSAAREKTRSSRAVESQMKEVPNGPRKGTRYSGRASQLRQHHDKKSYYDRMLSSATQGEEGHPSSRKGEGEQPCPAPRHRHGVENAGVVEG